MRGRGLGVSLALAAVVGGGVALGSPAPSYADDANTKKVLCSSAGQASQGTDQNKTFAPVPSGGPLDIMGVADAQEEVGSPGNGTRIALIDSGVAGGAKEASFKGRQPPAKDYHGTVAAGLIEHIAQDAELVDYPVLQVSKNQDKPPRVMTDSIATALLSLAGGKGKHLIVTVGVGIDEDSPRVASAVAALEKKGAIVVAAANWTGQNPSTDPDLSGQVFPAAYSGVVVVNVSHTTATDSVNGGANAAAALPNHDTTIAAPVFGAASRTLGNQECWVDTDDTGWAAAEVSGVLSLIWSRYPSLSAKEVIERLYGTASGREGSGGRFTGAGVAQAYDAVTEAIEPVTVKTVPVEKAQLGHPPTDILASVRRHAVWWGLGGGGALGIGLIMRPLFKRGRKASS